MWLNNLTVSRLVSISIHKCIMSIMVAPSAFYTQAKGIVSMIGIIDSKFRGRLSGIFIRFLLLLLLLFFFFSSISFSLEPFFLLSPDDLLVTGVASSYLTTYC